MTHRMLGALALVVGFGSMSGCSRVDAASSEGGSSPEARVEGQRLVLPLNSAQVGSLATAAALEAFPDSLRLTGRLTWNEDATVRVFSPFAGRVASVLTDAGREVRAGEPIALIASPDFGQAQADARRAETDLALAERTATRTRDLFEHGVVAQKDVESADAELSRMRSEQQRAHSRLALYGADSATTNQVFSLRAPLGGTVVERNVTPGQEVRPDQMLANAPQLFAPLFVITDPSRLWVVLDLPERDLPLLAAGSGISVHVQAWPSRAFPGRIALIASAVDPVTRTVKVRGLLENRQGLLKAEMLVSVTVPAAAKGGVSVPATALLFEHGAHVVFVDEGKGRFRRSEVEVGAEHDGLVPVRSGLAPGERVVTRGTLLIEQLFQSRAHS
ncbi:MAG: efflux RND transporter periplasmic adaptor subunit [Gemmatimonadales bacterium]